jgi:hypothetical protein
MSNNNNNNNNNHNGRWFALGAALLVVAAAFFNQTITVYAYLISHDFWQVMTKCWPVYVVGSMVGAAFGAIIARISGGNRKGFIAGAWLFPAGLLVCHILFVVWGVLTYQSW